MNITDIRKRSRSHKGEIKLTAHHWITGSERECRGLIIAGHIVGSIVRPGPIDSITHRNRDGELRRRSVEAPHNGMRGLRSTRGARDDEQNGKQHYPKNMGLGDILSKVLPTLFARG
jgi:hypothetical protein